MKYTTPTLAAALLALAVSPLAAQQEDRPAPPVAAPAAEEETPREAVDELETLVTRMAELSAKLAQDDATLEELREAQEETERLVEQIEALRAENAQRAADLAQLRATLEADQPADGEAAAAQAEETQTEAEEPQDTEPAAEPDDDMLDDNNGPVAQPAAQAVPAQPAARIAPAQAVPQRLVVRGNAAVQLVAPGVGGIARSFNAELDGLPELVLCAVTDGVTRDNDPSSYRFEAEGPGLLTVAVRAKNRDDMTIEVYNARGHQLARCDIDFGGNTGAEHLAVPIPEAGSYRVVVEPLGSGGAFWIGSSFLAFEGLEAMAPVTPDEATEVTPGQPQDAAVAAAGPTEQWFTFTAPSEGLLIFNTATNAGDLVIEAYANGDFENYFDYSDQDRNGSTGNERILVDMVEGQEVYMKVRPLSQGRDIEFTVRSQFVDTSE